MINFKFQFEKNPSIYFGVVSKKNINKSNYFVSITYIKYCVKVMLFHCFISSIFTNLFRYLMNTKKITRFMVTECIDLPPKQWFRYTSTSIILILYFSYNIKSNFRCLDIFIFTWLYWLILYSKRSIKRGLRGWSISATSPRKYVAESYSDFYIVLHDNNPKIHNK